MFSRKKKKQRIVQYNNYDYKTGSPEFKFEQSLKPLYLDALSSLLPSNRVDITFNPGDQLNKFSNEPYMPIRIDPRFSMRTNTPLSQKYGLNRWQLRGGNVFGMDRLPAQYTATGIVGDQALKALDRLGGANSNKPFCLSVHFVGPHPPFVATGEYMNPYWENEQWRRLFVSPSIKDSMQNSSYTFSNGRGRRNGFDNVERVAELTAV